jgi:RepB DNA-primase from phage plasmid
MDKTESAVRNMLTAIEAPLYDVGVLSDRGMLPGLDGIPAAAVLDRLALLKYRNAHGSHIYIRPLGEHRFTTLDDLGKTSLASLSADGFTPCAVVETSTGNFQAWLKHPRVFPKLLSTFAAQTLAARYDADPSAADWRRFGRLPGFTNCKPSTARRMVSSLLFGSRVTAVSSIRWPRSSRRKSRSSMKSESRSEKHDAHRRLFLPNGDRGYRICLLNDSAPPPNIRTGPPPQT